MYSVDDMRTPRDRIDEQLMRRLMESGEQQPECSCRGCEMPEENRTREREREVETMQQGCGCRESEMMQNRNMRTREAENTQQGCGCRESEMMQNRNMRTREAENTQQGCGCRDGMMMQNRNMRTREAENRRQNCGCRENEMMQNRGRSSQSEEGMARCRALADQPLAMVYSPCQVWRGVYDPEMGLRRGTIFKELDKPWGVERERSRGGCGCGR